MRDVDGVFDVCFDDNACYLCTEGVRDVSSIDQRESRRKRERELERKKEVEKERELESCRQPKCMIMKVNSILKRKSSTLDIFN